MWPSGRIVVERWILWTLLLSLPLLVGVGPCGSPSTPCSPSSVGEAEVSVRDWPTNDLLALRRVAQGGQILLVQYNGCGAVRPLWGCTQNHHYGYVAVSRPPPGYDAGASEAVSSPSGAFVAEGFEPAAPRSSACLEATHAVVSITGGAFEREGPNGTESFGNEGDCPTNPNRAECAAPMSLTLKPLESPKPVPPPVCAEGEVLSDAGACIAAAAPTQSWYVPDAKMPGERQVRAALDRLKRASDGESRLDALVELAAAYAECGANPAAQQSRIRALMELVEAPAAKDSSRQLRAFAELVQLTSTVGERSAHLDAANRMREQFPHAPESTVAYLTLARYYCSEGQPTAAERFFVQMSENIKPLPETAAAEIERIRKNCAPAPQAD